MGIKEKIGRYLEEGMSVKAMADYIAYKDSEIQDSSNRGIRNKWAGLVNPFYDEAKGNEEGWSGIAKKDPGVIERLFPLVQDFERKHRI
jgi:hypothetical protein